MDNYLELLNHILENGEDRSDRTGTGTRSVFAQQLKFNLKLGFPAVTTKKLAWKACASELVWFIEGSGDERRLAEIQHGTRDPSKKTIWTANAEADYWKPKAKFEGDLGRVYGVQWRNWRSATFADFNVTHKVTDQLKNLVEGLQKDPTGRRHILSAWNPGELDQMALPPCHMFAQFYLGKRGLSCMMTQRSCDVFLGLPFNIASYALLTHLIAKTIGQPVDELTISIGDAHIYHNHFDAVKEQLGRETLSLPTLDIEEVADIWTATPEQCKLFGYESHSTIKAPMAV